MNPPPDNQGCAPLVIFVIAMILIAFVLSGCKRRVVTAEQMAEAQKVCDWYGFTAKPILNLDASIAGVECAAVKP